MLESSSCMLTPFGVFLIKLQKFGLLPLFQGSNEICIFIMRAPISFAYFNVSNFIIDE